MLEHSTPWWKVDDRQRPKQTYDLRPLQREIDHVGPELQSIVLKRTTHEALAEHWYYIMTWKVPTMTRVNLYPSTLYASHSNHLGITGPALLQLSLAICLQLYPVSRAIRFHVEFADRYLSLLPPCRFHKSLTVPI